MTVKQGLVIAYFGQTVLVETVPGQSVACQLRRNQEVPVVGDNVHWQAQGDNAGVILDIIPRRSQLVRADEHGSLRPLAANLDVVVIVMSPPPIFSRHLLVRYLVAADLLHLAAVIVVNKADLLDADSRQVLAEELAPYQKLYPIIFSSTKTPDGMHDLQVFLAEKIAVLTGPSGVGKSSIISALTQEVIAVNVVSAKGVGKHTTTATRFYHLPGGGGLIDSPGIREFNLWSVTPQELIKGFVDFRGFLTGCKFRDCQHLAEPGCSLREAVARGDVHPLRYASYQELIREQR